MNDNRIEGMFGALKISSTGLAAQRRRLNAIAENLANVHTTRTEEGGPYRRKIVRFAEINRESTFTTNLARARLSVSTPRIGHIEPEDTMQKWRFSGVKPVMERDTSSPVLVYDPKHPDADEFGYVKMPNINIVKEMIDMISASRMYEANVTAIKATKEMAMKALEI